MNKNNFFPLTLLSSLAFVFPPLEASTTFTWTGGNGATPWHDPGNWDVNGAPNQTDGGGSGTTLGTEEEDALVVFDSETATSGYMPTETINVSTDWFGSGASDHLIPGLQVLNGTINLGSSGAEWWHYAGGNVYQIGDGDLTTSAQINTGFGNWTRHLDRGGSVLMTVNADGTVNQTGNMSVNNAITISLNGGAFVSSGAVTGLTAAGNRTINFDAAGSSFTAPLGSGDFTNLTAVNDQLGDSFVDNTGSGFTVQDNGSSFTVTVVPEPSTALLSGLGALGMLCLRRKS